MHYLSDSHEFVGETSPASPAGSSEPISSSQEQQVESNSADKKSSESASEYNPLIVRRSQRAIKPTKDIDLYLLGAQFGIDLEGSDADSSDLEFAPEVISEGEHVTLMTLVGLFCTYRQWFREC